jgi:hypothetical protein
MVDSGPSSAVENAHKWLEDRREEIMSERWASERQEASEVKAPSKRRRRPTL